MFLNTQHTARKMFYLGLLTYLLTQFIGDQTVQLAYAEQIREL